VSGSAESVGAKEAGRYLAELLTYRPYRLFWDQPELVRRTRKSELHYTAIAHALAEYLHVHPREGRPEDRNVEANGLTPLVSKTLNGVALGSETLKLFILAFRINREHATRLWNLRDGDGAIRLLPDHSAIPLDTIAAIPARRHITHSVHDHHYLGANGIPWSHQTLQVIEATVDGLDRYTYASDTHALTVEVFIGGKLGQPYDLPHGIHAVDIFFDHPLALGQRHTVKYETTFRYRTMPPPEFRRVATVRVEDVDSKVTFHPARLPKRVWQATWPDMASEPVLERALTLDDYHTVSVVLKDIENLGFGFVWEW
jgi:hypothetical protein